MPFELEIDESASERYFTDGGSLISVVPVGFDLEQGAAYTLTTTLDAGIGFDGHEFRFWISEIEGDSVRDFFSGAETKFIAAGDRSAVMQRILNEIAELVVLVEPVCVTMFSATANLPAVAVRKYEKVCETFAALGYVVEELEPQFGIRAWQFRLSP